MSEDVLFALDMESHPKAAFNSRYFPKPANNSQSINYACSSLGMWVKSDWETALQFYNVSHETVSYSTLTRLKEKKDPEFLSKTLQRFHNKA